MNFPRYWTKGSHTGKDVEGKEITISAFGWSSTDLEDARRVGSERAKRVLERGFTRGERTDYEYGVTPFREEVVESLEVDGEQVGVVSRNRYGALVLNTPKVMFVDIDFPEPASAGILDAILLMFSAKKREERQSLEEDVIHRSVQEWYEKNPSRACRLYRTHSGFRLLFTDKLYDPTSDESKRILSELKSDRLYCALTERQECYRARLTPKPWRCASTRPPSQFPWKDETEEKIYRAWLSEYEDACRSYATCVLKKEYGERASDPVIRKMIDFHDELSIKTGSPLA